MWLGLSAKDVVASVIGGASALSVWLLSHIHDLRKAKTEASSAVQVAQIGGDVALRTSLFARIEKLEEEIRTLRKDCDDWQDKHDLCERRYLQLEFDMRLLKAASVRTDAAVQVLQVLQDNQPT